LSRNLLALCAVGGAVLCGCAPVRATPTGTPAPDTPTPAVTLAFPTLPPTATLTPPPSLTPTPDIGARLGQRLLADDFSEDAGWGLGADGLGASSLEGGRLVLALHQNGTFRYVLAPDAFAGDFYLEVTLRTELCSPNDEFGVMVRLTPGSENYRIGLHCDGRARITRVLQDSSIALLLPTESDLIIAGAPAENRLAVMASGSTMTMFINGFEAFQVRDRAIISGRFALFVRAGRSTQLTVGFDDLEIYDLLPLPTATPAGAPPPPPTP
jgi:hypothetical protein